MKRPALPVNDATQPDFRFLNVSQGSHKITPTITVVLCPPYDSDSTNA